MRVETMGALRPVPAEPAENPIKPRYLEALTLIERLHRRLLDVIKDDFERSGEPEVNPVQALLLFNIADAELTAGELKTRGHYQGSNVSYNLKKLAIVQRIDSLAAAPSASESMRCTIASFRRWSRSWASTPKNLTGSTRP
jgi:hypothetical protein